eukprot:CAMPEP_0118683794 /NCGR_PEP_ID=MMETSP0800-20121206/6256_1 /TAXON_ID=210618 ORGANISM="Striatella unipunctata, Strain CCMP2910" /NCGR_SAMPLE_ID=MMETSP0800 /ASSEMBLY_ACC=CAM_ASM_000638 /LENGTH=270 /DNA_ID=CAMNT_0006580369 /DNA_START=273 /DNA_END=1085 /DNA_ORIENTATION=-
MGILNVTPDSFSDGGVLNDSYEQATKRALEMVDEGADIIDIGGESTRPGATPVELDEELRRTIPVIEKIRQESDIPISIDTRNSLVARAAVEAGADIVNDVSGGTHDEGMFRTVSELKVPIVIMHMRGTPETMQSMTSYDDVVEDVGNVLKVQSKLAEQAGIPRWLQVLDPGIGFAKELEGNLELLRKYNILRELVDDAPLLLGTSRKGFIGRISGEKIASNRDYGTIASCIAAICSPKTKAKASCDILRVHNVKATKQAIDVLDAVLRR